VRVEIPWMRRFITVICVRTFLIWHIEVITLKGNKDYYARVCGAGSSRNTLVYPAPPVKRTNARVTQYPMQIAKDHGICRLNKWVASSFFARATNATARLARHSETQNVKVNRIVGARTEI
jgi:hypothetical protein